MHHSLNITINETQSTAEDAPSVFESVIDCNVNRKGKYLQNCKRPYLAVFSFSSQDGRVGKFQHIALSASSITTVCGGSLISHVLLFLFSPGRVHEFCDGRVLSEEVQACVAPVGVDLQKSIKEERVKLFK